MAALPRISKQIYNDTLTHCSCRERKIDALFAQESVRKRERERAQQAKASLTAGRKQTNETEKVYGARRE